MADVYIFDKGCDDFASFGLVGALVPEECTFEEEANGMSELTLVHPLDAMGKYTAIERERILMAEVPVRTTPEIDGGKIVTSVEKWSVKATATKAERTIYRKKSGSSRLRVLGAGTEVTVVQKPESGRYKIKYSKWTGWMEPDGLDYITSATIADNSQSIESVQSAWKVKPQLFRIYSVEKGVDSVKAYARHISYDLLYNLTTYSNSGSVSCADALAGIMNGCINAHEFAAYTNLADARTGVNWKRINPISALLDPEEGLTARYSAALVRDNWEMYILRDPGMNRGVTVEYAKNMTGMRMTESTENVVTRIIPIGEKKDGSELLLDGTIWVDSARIADYPVVHAQELKCENCKVGTDGVTTGIARARMREQAKAVFDAGGDLPEIEMDVEFISLGDTAEFALYKDLDRLFLWDYVIVRHKKLDVDITARVVSIKWDCLRERMDRMEIGSVGKTLANTGINTWQIPTGFSGSKIAGGTIGGGALMQDIISTRHLQAESVNAEKIAAESITTSKLAASSVTAEKLEAGSVDAHVVAAMAGKFGAIDAGNIETDALGAELARISRLVARTADIDWAHIKDLTTDTAIITQGVGGKLMISRLAVTEANMVSLTTGELVVKGADGSFYAVSVDENGEIVATRKQIGNDDVVDLSINAGEKLIEGSVTTACLNATEIFADSAVVRELIAANLDVDRLFAREAFIDRLATSSIVGGRSLTAIAGTADAAKGAADAAKSAADTAQSAAEAAQGTADGAMLATAHVGVKPPEAPIPAGRQWLDQGVEPWTLRSWIGADVRTEPEYAQTHIGNPVVLDEGRVLSLDSIRNSFGPVQSGSGDPSPSNIRPISGWTGATLTRCGKNLLDLSQGYGYDELKPLNVPVGTSITFSLFPTNGTSQFNGRIIYEDDTNHDFAIIGKNADNNIWHTYTITPEKQIKEYSIYDVDFSNKRTISKGMIEYSSTVTPYEPYQGDTYAADFGQTVYGGTLDWLTGVLTVDKAMVTLTGNENITTASTNTSGKVLFNYALPGAKSNTDNSIITGDILCSHHTEISPNNTYKCNVGVSIGRNGVLSIYDSTYAALTLDDFKSYIAAQYAAGTPVQVCYRLAEPIVVQLNLPAVYPLEGTNVLYGGAGALEVDSTASGWRVVNDPAELQSAQEALALQQARMDEALNRLGMAMVLDADGVHVHRPVTNPPCETLTADDSFNVLVNSAIAATFAASYQKMGGQIVVRQTSNGLIFGG